MDHARLRNGNLELMDVLAVLGTVFIEPIYEPVGDLDIADRLSLL